MNLIEGIEDKIINTKGYCCVVIDEGSGFFDDLKKKESKHKSFKSIKPTLQWKG